MRLTRALADHLKVHMPEETVLITPTLGEGRRLLQTVAAAGQLLVGVRAVTPLTLAREICARQLSEDGAPRLPESAEAQDLLFRTLKAMPPVGFFAGEHAKDRKTAELMYGVLTELDENLVGTVSGNARQDAIHALRGAYAAAKKQEGLLDPADLLALAAKAAGDFYAEGRPYFVTLSCYQFTKAERALLHAVAGDALQIVPVELPVSAVAPADCLQAGTPTMAVDTASFRFVRCRGMETEARFILRDILEQGYAAEDCAVLYLSADYAPTLYTEARLFHLPITIAGGIPMTGSLIYDALRMLADWQVSDFDAEQLRTLILSGAIRLPAAGRFAARLREKNIGWGADRYLGRFLTVTEDEKYPPEAEDIVQWRAFLEAALQIARRAGSLEEQKARLADFLSACSLVRAGEDAASLNATLRMLRSISWLDEGEDVLGRLLELMEQSCCMTGHEEAGKLLALPLSQAFCTGRKVLYICGMSRFSMQGSRQESPLLLDEEKQAYGLKTMLQREQENTFRLSLLLLQHQGTAVLSYCDYDTERMIALQPAPLYRALAAGRDAEQVTCIPQKALTLGDLQGTGTPVRLAQDVSRAPEEDTEPLTLAPDEGYAAQLGRMAFAPTSLEEALACPLKFYLKRVLGLIPAELPERSSDAWLDAAELGSLCHAVLERFYAGEGSLDEVFAEELSKLREDRPLARASAVEADTRRAKNMVDRAVRWTGDSCHQVVSTEKHFGKNAGGAPLQLQIGDRVIGLSGSIDRVDRLPDGTLAILDYKTGTSKYYRENEAIKLQPYLYARALEQLQPGVHVTDSGYLFLKDSADYFAVPQTEAARAMKEKTITGLLTWLENEDRAMTAAPAFYITETEGLEVAGNPEDREKQYKSCGRWCEYAGFCMAPAQIGAEKAAGAETAQTGKEEAIDA